MDAKSRAALVVVATLLALTVTGCKDEAPAVSSASVKGLDSSADQACTVFAARHGKAASKAARLRLADEIGRSAARSDNGAVSGRAALVGRSASRGDAAWRSASARLLEACRSAGWKSRRG